MGYLNKSIKFVFYIVIVGTLLYVVWACFFVATFHGDTYGKSEAYVIDINTNTSDRPLNSADILDLLYGFHTHLLSQHTSRYLLCISLGGC